MTIKQYFTPTKLVLLLTALLMIMSQVAFPVSVKAAIEADFYVENDILYFDPNATQCNPAAPGGATTGTDVLPVASGENEKIVYQYFIGKGFSSEQSAGIVGNFMHETGGTMDPNTRQFGGGPGRGIAQWETGAGGRWVPLVQFARDSNRSEWDLMVQLDYVMHEFQTTEKRAFDHLKQQTTVQAATISVLDKYERAGDRAETERLKYANAAFSKFSGLGGIGGSAISGGCGGTAAGVSGGTVVQIAEAEFAKGIVEQPPRCDAGNPSTKGTCGPEIDKYTDNTLEYWCADFVSWVMKTAGTPFTGGQSGGWRIAGVSSVRSWFENNAIFVERNDPNYDPQPGDVIIYSYSHTDIVVARDGNNMVTIGGNTGVGDSRNGSGVGKKSKSIDSTNIIGYGRMN